MPMGMYYHEFTVKGGYAFPVDMLRYDHCYPRDTESALAMTYTIKDEKLYMEERVIHLGTVSVKTWTPTDARWQSFGWEVSSHTCGHCVNG